MAGEADPGAAVGGGGAGGGGGGGPVTAADITDASTSGKSVLTGTPAAGRSALGLGSAAQQPTSAFVSPTALDQRVSGFADLLEPSGYRYVVKVNGTSLLDMAADSAQSFFGLSGIGGHGDRDVLDFYSGKQVVGRDLLDPPL